MYKNKTTTYKINITNKNYTFFHVVNVTLFLVVFNLYYLIFQNIMMVFRAASLALVVHTIIVLTTPTYVQKPACIIVLDPARDGARMLALNGFLLVCVRIIPPEKCCSTRTTLSTRQKANPSSKYMFFANTY